MNKILQALFFLLLLSCQMEDKVQLFSPDQRQQLALTVEGDSVLLSYSYIVVARAAGEDWFIGSLTNREGRDVEIYLDFLPKGSTYLATIYSDADDSNFLTNKESYKIEEQEVDPGAKLKVRLAPGGGNAIHLKKL
nr:glycoside hydrolase family 97 C-terminal domain-containing protein [uncultured Draconibacterium sp.]